MDSNDQTIETWKSSDEEKDLFVLEWEHLAGQEGIWRKLLEVLAALGAREDRLGTAAGTIKVVSDDSGNASSCICGEEWPVALGQPVLRQSLAELERRYRTAVAAGNLEIVPEYGLLLMDTYVFLPAGVKEVQVIASDVGELLPLGPLPLRLAPETNPADDGYVRWRVAAEPDDWESPLFWQIGGELSDMAQAVTLRLCSRFDLLRPRRFDNTANGVHATYNIKRLGAILDDLARETAGQVISRPAPND
jgi:hypothetical protein